MGYDFIAVNTGLCSSLSHGCLPNLRNHAKFRENSIYSSSFIHSLLFAQNFDITKSNKNRAGQKVVYHWYSPMNYKHNSLIKKLIQGYPRSSTLVANTTSQFPLVTKIISSKTGRTCGIKLSVRVSVIVYKSESFQLGPCFLRVGLI